SAQYVLGFCFRTGHSIQYYCIFSCAFLYINKYKQVSTHEHWMPGCSPQRHFVDSRLTAPLHTGLSCRQTFFKPQN
uniref:Uncharacterized protein n=1 Tax=Xenopus tropicalis TaxID=8364 RepID=A0A6I8RN69_XENTR